jgi:hypothetical protein
MISIIIISILSSAIVILTYATYNLMKKQEASEDILLSYLNYLDKISRVIEISDDKLKKLDQRESFKSDDEVGFFFEQIKKIQEILNEFKIKQP